MFCCFSSLAEAKVSPSFDCRKAKSEVEKLVCSDDELSGLDIELNKRYSKIKRYRKFIFQMNKSYDAEPHARWLKKRNHFECTPKVANKKKCLVSLYQEGIQLMKNRQLSFYIKTACKTKYFYPNDDYSLPMEESFSCDFSLADKAIREGADINGLVEVNGCPAYFEALYEEAFAYILTKNARVTERITNRNCAPGAYLLAAPYTKELLKMDSSIINYTSNNLHQSLLFFNKGMGKDDVGRIKFLCSYGIDANIQDLYGRTSLIEDLAGGCPSTKENLLIVKELIKCGSNISLKDKWGRDALSCFKSFSEYCKEGEGKGSPIYDEIVKLLSY